MRITDFSVDGYGVWSGLRVERLTDTLNVFYGPNEAGKTTLLEFVRSVLYGFSPERAHYLPPVHGGRGGGTLDVAGPQGRYQIARHTPADDGTPGEQLLLTSADGTRQGEHYLSTLLSNVEEPVFNNVFAVGLREIQELATLSDTAAAELLYSLTAGLDRVSLVEVLRELHGSRNRILDAAGGTCQAVQLLAEHEKLRTEIQELQTINHRYAQLATERDQLQGEMAGLEDEAERTGQLAQTADAALAVYDLWHQRISLDEQLAAFGPPKTMPEDAISRLDALVARLQRYRQHVNELAESRAKLRREYAGLAVNESLWRQTARIEAMKEQEPWIAQLIGDISRLEGDIAAIRGELTAEAQRLGLLDAGGAPAADDVPWPSTKQLASLRSPARLWRESRQRLKDAKRAAATAAATADSLAGQIATSLNARGQKDLTTALDQAGNVVSQLRRREQLEGRLDQLARHQGELDERSRGLADRQVLPVGVLVGLGGVFVFGVVLILAGLLMPASITGSIGWALSLLGLVGSGAAGFGKVMLERSNAAQLDACHKQLDLLHAQVEQTKADCDAVDSQLPRGGGPIAVRLQTADRELAALQELAPLNVRCNAARQEADAAARRVSDAAAETHDARRRWRHAISAAGLPETITPQQARRLSAHGDRIGQWQRDLASRKEELARRRQERDSLVARLVQLAADAGVPLDGQKPEIRNPKSQSADPAAILAKLVEAAAAQQAMASRREAIRRESRKARSAQTKRQEAMARLEHRRRALFIEAGVKDEQEFRQRALECASAEALRQQRGALAREIDAALASRCSEEAVEKQLKGSNRGALETRRNELQQRAAVLHDQLRVLLEKRGRLSEQLDAMAADNRLAARRLDLAQLEKRIEDALHRWQVLAATCSVLDAIRLAYEKDRQPETLQEASGYLDRLTQGRYCRVWTPLGEHVLRVDDAEGRSLPVESLSRGTREQLFLSLRLALASLYGRRGAELPLVLDDVLVNFDAGRAKAAAAVLRDFAAAGHQLLVFTCHEHIQKLFKSLKTPVSRLPDNATPGEVVIRVERPSSDEKPKREKRSRQSRRSAEAEVEAAHADAPEIEEDRFPAEEPAALVDDDQDGALWDEEDDGEAGEFDEPDDDDAEAA
ncbi:MAG: AAA family ATPase [Thermoguttaceae bacterium]